MKYGLFSTIQSLFGYKRLEVNSAKELLEFARGTTSLGNDDIVPAEFRCFFEIAKFIPLSQTAAQKEELYSAGGSADFSSTSINRTENLFNNSKYHTTTSAETKDPLDDLANALYDFTTAEESQYKFLNNTPKSNDSIMGAIAALKTTYTSPEHTELFDQLASITSNTYMNFATDIACR